MVQAFQNKIACIGAGYWGRNLVRNFNELGVLSSVCELDPQTRAHLKPQYPNVIFTDVADEVFADPGITGVAVATPAVTHAELVERALLFRFICRTVLAISAIGVAISRMQSVPPASLWLCLSIRK